MVFKNQKELEKFMLSKCQSALTKAQEKVYRIIDKFLNDFYDDYDPSTYVDLEGNERHKRHYYVRTYQLLHSLVKSEIVPSKNGYEAKVYFDSNYLNSIYSDGNHPSGLQVMEAAAQGLHGAIGEDFQYVEGRTGVSVWNDPIKQLNAEAIDILVDMLKAEGIPVVKG